MVLSHVPVCLHLCEIVNPYLIETFLCEKCLLFMPSAYIIFKSAQHCFDS